MVTDLAYPKCPKCGSTSHCCWILATKSYCQRNRWHRERMAFDYRRFACVECGAPEGEVCRTQGDCPTKAHKQRRADFRQWLRDKEALAQAQKVVDSSRKLRTELQHKYDLLPF